MSSSLLTLQFWLINGASALAILALGALAWWSRRGAPAFTLTEGEVRESLAEAFPDAPVEAVSIDAQGATALVRSGERALIAFRMGDYVVARSTAWSDIVGLQPVQGRVRIALHDAAAPFVDYHCGAGAWPPVPGGKRV